MTKKLKLSIILLSVVMVACIGLAVGLSAAVWRSDGVGGDTTVSPAATISNWNAWNKYFQVVDIDESQHTAALSVFYYTDDDGSYGLNLGQLVIPISVPVTIEGTTTNYDITRITNSVFKDNTLKELPITIYISSSVKQIDAGAFANLPNLEHVVFATSGCNVSAYAFMGCENLDTVEIMQGCSATFDSSAFAGCSELTSKFIWMNIGDETTYKESEAYQAKYTESGVQVSVSNEYSKYLSDNGKENIFDSFKEYLTQSAQFGSFSTNLDMIQFKL